MHVQDALQQYYTYTTHAPVDHYYVLVGRSVYVWCMQYLVLDVPWHVVGYHTTGRYTTTAQHPRMLRVVCMCRYH